MSDTDLSRLGEVQVGHDVHKLFHGLGQAGVKPPLLAHGGGRLTCSTGLTDLLAIHHNDDSMTTLNCRTHGLIWLRNES